MTKEKNQLINFPVNTRIKLAFLWTTIMSLYIYADYFSLMTPNSIKSMMELRTPIGPATPGLLIGFSVLLIIPALVIPASIFLKPAWAKWINIIVGFVYAIISVLIAISNMGSEWMTFMILYQAVEIFVFALIIWQAWNWPKEIPAIE
jgi:hypothetical protein